MALVYRTVYQGNFCTFNDAHTNNIVYILQRMEDSLPIPTPIPIQFSGDEPVTLEYADKGDYKLYGVNGLVCTINISAIDSFELSSLYTADEREWKVIVTGLLDFEGYLIPDSCSEPYDNKPYDVKIQATDALGTLEDIPFAQSDGVTYKGFKSDIDVLTICLAKTGLSLEMLVGVNTYEATMSTSLSPLEQTYIDCARFLDAEGNPFGCITVIESILNRWSARLHQFNGVWQIINVLEKSRGNVKAWKYTPIGNSDGFTTLGNTIIAGGQNRDLQPQDGINETAKGFKSSTAYYQYGYPSNQLYNGNFDIATPPAIPTSWTSVGSATGSSAYRIDSDTGLNTSDVYFSVIQNGPSNNGYFLNSSPVQIRANQKANISFAMLIPAMASGPDTDRYLDILIQDNLGKYYTNNGWVATAGYYRITYRRTDFYGQVNVSFDVNFQPNDYQMSIGIKAITYINSGTTIYMETRYNDISVKPQTVSSLTAPPLGLFNRQTVTSAQTYTKDPIRILHSDETNPQRTSRILINNSTIPTKWKRAAITEATELLRVVANSELRLHQRPYNIFNAKFVGEGYIDINTLLSVDLLSASGWIFLSGKFDLKTGYHTLRFAEILINEPNYSDGGLIEDYGSEKDKNGVSVGQPSTAPPNPGGANPVGVSSAASKAEVLAGTITDKYVSPFSLDVGYGNNQMVRRDGAGNIGFGASSSAGKVAYSLNRDIIISANESLSSETGGVLLKTRNETRLEVKYTGEVLINDLEANDADIINATVDDADITNATIADADITNATIGTANVDVLQVNTSIKIPVKNSSGTVVGVAEVYIEI